MSPTLGIIQARMTSIRLPGKVLADIHGRPMLEHVIRRVRRAKRVDGVLVATTTRASDDPVVALCSGLGVETFRGDEHDVLGRYAAAARWAGAETVVRITADCPMSDPEVIDRAVALYDTGDWDYVSNVRRRTYPVGLDVEVFGRALLERMDQSAHHAFEREHVTPFVRGTSPVPTNRVFRCGEIEHVKDLSHLRWTVDTAEDLARARRLFAMLPDQFTWLDALAVSMNDARAPSGGCGTALREATWEDVGVLYEWVNTADSLAAKLSTQNPIPREHHEHWFAERLADRDTRIWIAQNDEPIGQVRVQRVDGVLDVDVFVAPGSRRCGIAGQMLDEGATLCAEKWPGLTMRARIKNTNQPSIRLFASLGYEVVERHGDHVVMHRSL